MRDTFNLFNWGQRLSKVLKLLAMSFVLFFMAAGATQWSLGDNQTAAQPQKTLMAMQLRAITRQPKVICFTRFLIDIPATAQVAYGRLTAGGELTRVPDGAEKIEALIVERIRANKKNSEIFSQENGQGLVSEKIHPSSKEDIKHLLSIIGGSQYNIHSFFKINRDAYVLSERGVPETFVNEFLSDNVTTASFLRGREENEIPKEPGICIDGAFSNIESIYEGIELGARIKEYPDVHFSIRIIKNAGYLQKVDLAGNVADTIEESKANGLGKWVSRLKILRQGKHVVNDWHGEEMLLRIPSGNGNPSHHKFTFRASGEKNDPLHPFVEMTLDTGVKGNKSASVEPSLSDEEALALWDWLLNSIRVRPNAVAAKASAPAKPGA